MNTPPDSTPERHDDEKLLQLFHYQLSRLNHRITASRDGGHDRRFTLQLLEEIERRYPDQPPLARLARQFVDLAILSQPSGSSPILSPARARLLNDWLDTTLDHFIQVRRSDALEDIRLQLATHTNPPEQLLRQLWTAASRSWLEHTSPNGIKQRYRATLFTLWFSINCHKKKYRLDQCPDPRLLIQAYSREQKKARKHAIFFLDGFYSESELNALSFQDIQQCTQLIGQALLKKQARTLLALDEDLLTGQRQPKRPYPSRLDQRTRFAVGVILERINPPAAVARDNETPARTAIPVPGNKRKAKTTRKMLKGLPKAYRNKTDIQWSGRPMPLHDAMHFRLRQILMGVVDEKATQQSSATEPVTIHIDLGAWEQGYSSWRFSRGDRDKAAEEVRVYLPTRHLSSPAALEHSIAGVMNEAGISDYHITF